MPGRNRPLTWPERRSLPLYGRYGIYEAAHCGIRCFLFGLNIRFQHASNASTLKRYGRAFSYFQQGVLGMRILLNMKHSWSAIRWRMLIIFAFFSVISMMLVACIAVAVLNVVIRRESAYLIEERIKVIV